MLIRVRPIVWHNGYLRFRWAPERRPASRAGAQVTRSRHCAAERLGASWALAMVPRALRVLVTAMPPIL
jgi:hypothetical protein